MNKQTETFAIMEQRGVIIDELILETKRVNAAVVAGAMIEPKIPPLVGD